MSSDKNSIVLPVLPLPDGVVFPGMVVSIALETEEARRAATAATSNDGQVLLVPRLGGEFSSVGTIAKIQETGRMPRRGRVIVVQGLGRALIGQADPRGDDVLWVNARPVEDAEDGSTRVQALERELRAVIEALLELRGVRALAERMRRIDSPGALADAAGYSPDITPERTQELLETLDVRQRLEKATTWLKETLADLQLKEKIRNDVAEDMDKAQRDHLLRQQLAAIRRELGESGDDEVEDYRSRIETSSMPLDAREAALRELSRLERLSEQSPEHGWIRNWLDWMLEMPWSERSEDVHAVESVREVLDADHAGLDDVKLRIVEHLAVRKLRAERSLEAVDGRRDGMILALVGPPGVGKTSLGESVAAALGRSFARVALGGVRDEAEIRGHRRTYVGAQPGRFVRALKEAGTSNPVLLLDEIDKVGSDWRGDPAAALLEVLDPAQNQTFRDHYLEVELDLSDVLFIATANVLESVPKPLLDRLEVITLDGYTDDEKLAIARGHLLPRQMRRNGLLDDEVSVSDDALEIIIEDYTREAGVRSLERQIGKVLRKAATRIAEAPARDAVIPIDVDPAAVRFALGRSRLQQERADVPDTPGVATGLAVTGVGGDVLYVEAAAMSGEPSLTVTGQLGEVMNESAQIARSLVHSRADVMGVDSSLLDQRLHLHVPAGAVPKDGPSAGVTMVTALASLLRGKPVRPGLAMTGEVTLQGRVLPVGGIKQKVLAAHRAGLTDVILPARNEADLDDVPEPVRNELNIHLVSTVNEVLRIAFGDAERRVETDGDGRLVSAA